MQTEFQNEQIRQADEKRKQLQAMTKQVPYPNIISRVIQVQLDVAARA